MEFLLDDRGDPWTWVFDESVSENTNIEPYTSTISLEITEAQKVSQPKENVLSNNNNSVLPDQSPIKADIEVKNETIETTLPIEALRVRQSDDEFIAETAWKEQEEKAKRAEMEARNKARQARSRQLTAKDIDIIMAHYRQNQKSLWTEFSERPQNRNDVVRWFRRRELQRHSITDEYGCIPAWFHGLIGRNDAEKLLASDNVAVGSFLVRLNERIWGYAVSYKRKFISTASC